MARKNHGEIIWRLTYQVDATTNKQRPEPVLLLLADKRGWLSLAKLFLRKAERPAPEYLGFRRNPDPDDHWHFGLHHPGLNAELSHSLELRLGTITPQTRADVLDKYNILPPLKRDRDLRCLFRRLIREIKKDISETNRMLRKRSKRRKPPGGRSVG